jgi:hypothetical protein
VGANLLGAGAGVLKKSLAREDGVTVGGREVTEDVLRTCVRKRNQERREKKRRQELAPALRGSQPAGTSILASGIKQGKA